MKVAAPDGAVDVSQVIAAIDWVVQHRAADGLNIRVLNLSFGTDGIQDYQVDPLTFAVENAWRHGIVVVVSAGNDGYGSPRLNNPAYDPYVLAVGASDTNGTTSQSDDFIADFSSRGDINAPPRRPRPRPLGRQPPRAGLAHRRGVPRRPRRREAVPRQRHLAGRRGHLGRGRAAAPAVPEASRPTRSRPRSSTPGCKLKTRKGEVLESGMKSIDLDKAADKVKDVLAGKIPSAQTFPPATGLGSLEAARGTEHLTDGDNVLAGESRRHRRRRGTASRWRDAAWEARAWSDGAWDGARWRAGNWNGSRWRSDGWTGAAGAPGAGTVPAGAPTTGTAPLARQRMARRRVHPIGSAHLTRVGSSTDATAPSLRAMGVHGEPSGAWFNPVAEFLGTAYLRNAFTMGTEQEVGFLVETLGLEPGMTVLDVGCGPGRHSLALARRGITVDGVDLAPDFVRLATEAATAEDLPATFRELDVRDLDVDGHYDAVVCLCQGGFGLLGGDDEEDVLRRIARAVRPADAWPSRRSRRRSRSAGWRTGRTSIPARVCSTSSPPSGTRRGRSARSTSGPRASRPVS